MNLKLVAPRLQRMIILFAAVVAIGCTGAKPASVAPETPPDVTEAHPGEDRAPSVSPDALHQAGMAALAQGRYDEAVDALRTVTAVRGSADDWNDLGYALGKLGRWAESAEACRRAVTLDKRHAYALYNLGWAEYQLGQYLPARTHIGQSDALQDGQRWETRYALGQVSEALGELSRAATDYEAAAGLAKHQSDEPAKALERVRDHLPLPLPPPDGWTVYTNGRFGFRIFHPEDWTPGPPPTNGDGRYFTSPDGKSEIRAWGGFQLTEPPKWQPDSRHQPFLYGWLEPDPPTTKPGMRSLLLHATRTDEEVKIEYGVVITAPADQWAKLQPLIDTVMRSFKITFGNAYVGY